MGRDDSTKGAFQAEYTTDLAAEIKESGLLGKYLQRKRQ
jgi:hypothetical protein